MSQVKRIHIHLRITINYPYNNTHKTLRDIGFTYSQIDTIMERSTTMLFRDMSTATMWDMYVLPTPKELHVLAENRNTCTDKLIPSLICAK